LTLSPARPLRALLAGAVIAQLIALCLAFAAFAADISFPALTGRVVDEAGALSAPATARLTAELAAHEQRSGQQVVVAIVKSLQGQAIEDYGYQLGRFWGIGQKGKNTGAILLVAPSERKVRIEVGYGLEGDLTDAASAVIINQVILPRFRQGDIQGGVVLGAEAMLRTLGDDLPAPAAPMRQQRPQQGGRGSIGSIILTFVVFALFMWFARGRGGGGGGGMILPLMMAGSWSSRGRESGGGDSGFSGGGGSFGGGGASGSW
jgi:uncharacterized protein